MSSRRKRLIGISFGIFLLASWQIIADIIGKSYILPGPLEVIKRLWESRAEIFTVHLPATMTVVLIGGTLSVFIGLLFAVAMDADKRIEKAIYPILSISQTIPVVCIAPVFVLWFGYSLLMRVIVVILINFFAVAVNVFDGFKAVDSNSKELMKTMGASKLQILFMLKLPTALPYFFTAVKIAVPWSLVGAAVAEWLGAPNGMGTYSRSCIMNLDTAGLIAPLVVLTAIALILNTVLRFAEGRLVKR